ncbi:MAG: hypothetical protein GY854_19750 [Deltaproteobacteria bacterium]|nr:hypothetical protein [Deltaproteobacteria bacterium]
MAEVRNYRVTLTGISPLLMHADNIEWRDQVTNWRNDPLHKKKGTAGDDRSPAWSWVGYVYHDGQNIGLPSDNLMTCIRDGASMVVVKGNKTFKSQSQSGILVNEILWPIEVDGIPVSWEPTAALVGEEDFEEHKKIVSSCRYELSVKPAKVGTSKHIRVRPRFNKWQAAGTISVFDDMITPKVLDQILFMAGNYCGICDWRPKGRSPGQFGRFEAKVERIK